jgi:hypothetical protein
VHNERFEMWQTRCWRSVSGRLRCCLRNRDRRACVGHARRGKWVKDVRWKRIRPIKETNR